MKIDVHAHYFPARYNQIAARRSARDGQDMGAGDGPGQVETRLADMDAAGVQMQILSTAARGPYFPAAGDAVEAARVANDTYAELVARHPKRFDVFASVPLPHLDATMRELERALDTLGMVGVTVTTSVLQKPLVEPEFEPFFAELDRRHAPLFIHPAGAGACSPHILNYGLEWAIGAPVEDTVVALQLLARQIPVRYPNLKIILAHLGGALPMLVARLEHLMPSYTGIKLGEPPLTTLRRMWYDTVAHNSIAALRCACETLGADRIVLGSDFPYMREDWYRGAVSHIQQSGLSQAAIDQILERNAMALLGLKERA